LITTCSPSGRVITGRSFDI